MDSIEKIERANQKFIHDAIEHVIATYLSNVTDKVFLGFLRGHTAALRRNESMSVEKAFEASQRLERYVNAFIKDNPNFDFDYFHDYYLTFNRALVHYAMSHTVKNDKQKKAKAENLKEVLEDVSGIDATGEFAAVTTWEKDFFERIIQRTKTRGESSLNTLRADSYFDTSLSDKQLNEIANYLFGKQYITDTSAFRLFLKGKNLKLNIPQGKLLYFIEAMKILYKEKKVIWLNERNNTCLSHVTNHILDFSEWCKKSKPSQYLSNLTKQKAADAGKMQLLRKSLYHILR